MSPGEHGLWSIRVSLCHSMKMNRPKTRSWSKAKTSQRGRWLISQANPLSSLTLWALVWVRLSSKQITGGLVFITGDGRRANQSCWALITGWTEIAKETSSFVFLLSPHFWACDQRRACFFLVCQSSMSLFIEKVQLLFMAFWIFTRTRLFPSSMSWEPVVFLIASSGTTF